VRPPPSTVSFDIEGLQLAASPWISILSFTHIFGKSLDKGIAKAEVISISTMAIVLPGSFTKSVCKMWVKDRAKARGLQNGVSDKGRPVVIGC